MESLRPGDFRNDERPEFYVDDQIQAYLQIDIENDMALHEDRQSAKEILTTWIRVIW